LQIAFQLLNPLLVGLDSMAFSAFIMFESVDRLVDAYEVGITQFIGLGAGCAA
jgi:hypothetical protein